MSALARLLVLAAVLLAGCSVGVDFSPGFEGWGPRPPAPAMDGETDGGETDGEDTSGEPGEPALDLPGCVLGSLGCECTGYAVCDPGLLCEVDAWICEPAPPGSLGCECDLEAGLACLPGLACSAGVCEDCPAGDPGCACAVDGDPCGAADLACEAGVCEVVAPCPERSEGCACDGGGACDGDGDLLCDLDAWVCEANPCPPGSEGCACSDDGDGGGECDGDLVCWAGECLLDPGPCELVSDLATGHGGWDLVSLPVIGVMTDAAVHDACTACGFEVPCANSETGGYWQLWDDTCVQVWPAFTEHGGRMLHGMIALTWCNDLTAGSWCEETQGLFAYAAGLYLAVADGPSMGAVGAMGGEWAYGVDHADQRAICAD